MPPVHYRAGAFPPDARLDWPKLIPLIGPAAAAVARYDGVLAAVPHPSVLLAPLATQEAVLSSRIEGTRATMGEVLEYEAGRRFDSPALLGDIGEILNYLSGYFEERRSAYYEGLLAVSRDDDWSGWCVLFLNAVRSQAESTLAKAQGILDLYEEMVPQVTAMTRSPSAIQALRWLFGRPVFRSADFAATAGLPSRTAHRLLRGLLEAGILTTVSAGNGRRATVLGFPRLLNLVEGRKVL